MWQEVFERYSEQGFTVVGLALDVEGVPPAKRYYEQFGVEFPALVDPNYATGFGVVPKTFFIDEHGVVQELQHWEARLKPTEQLRPITEQIRQQWSRPGQRLDASSIADLVQKYQSDPADLATAVELASRYLDLDLATEARCVLQESVEHYAPHDVARSPDRWEAQLLAQAYLQLARASHGDRDVQVKYATLSFYLHPTVGFGKQIARIISPEKFDGRPGGGFDNQFREGTLRRLQQERREWLERN